MGNHQPRRPIDEQRRRIFLKILGETGSIAAAAAAATPHSVAQDGRAGRRSFEDLIRRDPAFAEEVAEAQSRALARIEAEIMERAFTPDERPIVDKHGNVRAVQVDRRNANQMLLRAAEAIAPERWAPRKQFSGKVAHAHLHAHKTVTDGGFVIDANTLDLLPEHRRQDLLDLLVEIDAALEQKETADVARRLPEATDP